MDYTYANDYTNSLMTKILYLAYLIENYSQVMSLHPWSRLQACERCSTAQASEPELAIPKQPNTNQQAVCTQETGQRKNEKTAPVRSRIKCINWILGSAPGSFMNSNSQPIHMLIKHEVYCSQTGQIFKSHYAKHYMCIQTSAVNIK